MKTTPTAALEVLLGLPPLDLFIQQEAASAAVRLKTLKLWGTAIGAHAEILVEAINYKPLMAAPNDRVPKQYIFGKNYTVRLTEEQHDWSGTHELRIYTDGSKTRTGSGAGVFSPEINIKISMALGAHSSIYQCECVAITEAAKAVEKRGLIGHKIRIVTDSAAVLRALDSKTIQSGLILECHQALEGIGKTNSVTLQWIKGHSGSLGNDAADELAKENRTRPYWVPNQSWRSPFTS
ncbi:ribonuclease H-like [Manduca sexta]|uniref:ribonuclease H-like n=1 Tax=Manduca sexta TaxID=7130 RepID=UPI00188F65D0|nr:ribonuclease H-like [Manduca sexta]